MSDETPQKKALQKPGAQLVPQRIASMIQIVRGEKILLDSDLAKLYGVETKALNQAVKRNTARFAKDFMFQRTFKEWENLRGQIGTSSSERTSPKAEATLKSQTVTSSYGGRRTPPYAFTEQGVAMLSSVLRSPRAVEANIAIMRTFVQLRQLMDNNRLLAEKIESLEAKYQEHEANFQTVFKVIKQLITDKEKPTKRKAGFHGD